VYAGDEPEAVDDLVLRDEVIIVNRKLASPWELNRKRG
jgi:hypothetical protein